MTAISVAHDCGMVKISDQLFILTLENKEDPHGIPDLKFERASGNLPTDSVTVDFSLDVRKTTFFIETTVKF